MILFVALTALLCLYKIRLFLFEKPKIKIYDDYMSLEKSTSIKGIFIIIVLLSHAAAYVELSGGSLDRLYDVFNYTIIGQSMISIFMLYSGYAVMLSAMKKGRGYVLSMPKNRILKVLLHFDIAVLMFLIVQTCLGNTFSVDQILLSFLGWSAIGNSNWYIFVILVLYIISFVSLAVCKNNYKLVAAMSFVLTAAFVLVLHAFKEVYWYDTAMIYPVGMLYCLYKGKIEDLFKKKEFIYWLALVLCAGATVVLIKFRSNAVLVMFKHLFFAFTVLLATMKVQIHNKFLFFCGKHLFSIYILQRIPMILLAHFGVSSNKYLFVILSLAFTLLICVPFDWALGKLDSVLFKKND